MAESGGWLRLHRDLFESEVWGGALIDRLVWIWILGHARYSDTPSQTPEGAIVRRGDCYASMATIGRGIAWRERNGIRTPSKASIHRALASLESAGRIQLIDTPAGAKSTHIRILNWDRYQDPDRVNDNQPEDVNGKTVCVRFAERFAERIAERPSDGFEERATANANTYAETGSDDHVQVCGTDAGADCGTVCGTGFVRFAERAKKEGIRRERDKNIYTAGGGAPTRTREETTGNADLPMDDLPPAPAPTKPSTAGLARFPEFWDAWPRGHRKARRDAERGWRRAHLDTIADRVIADVLRRAVEDRQWIDGYIPHPSTYINQARWEDDITPPMATGNTKRNGHAHPAATGATEITWDERVGAWCDGSGRFAHPPEGYGYDGHPIQQTNQQPTTRAMRAT